MDSSKFCGTVPDLPSVMTDVLTCPVKTSFQTERFSIDITQNHLKWRLHKIILGLISLSFFLNEMLTFYLDPSLVALVLVITMEIIYSTKLCELAHGRGAQKAPCNHTSIQGNMENMEFVWQNSPHAVLCIL